MSPTHADEAHPAPRRVRRSRSVVTTAAALGLLVLAACAGPAPVLAPALSGDVPAGLERFYAQQLSWGPCAPLATNDIQREAFADPAFDCARLEVPLDYAAPDGRTAQIAVLRQQAATGERIGSLVTNPGGPGGSGMELVAGMGPGLADGPLGQRFDIVGFDPRGVGASTPTLDCLTDAEWEADRADVDLDPSLVGIAQVEAENREFAQQCAERSGGMDVLANAGTRDVVRDMDVLRAALGDEKLTYLGYSYGTRIGTAYAEAFPRNVRALVLDGVVDPTADAADESVAQMAGFQQAFEAYAVDCAARPDCPLGTDPAQATAAFQALTRPLIDAPVPAYDDTLTLSYNDALTGTITTLYSSEVWPVLSQGLSELANGDGTTLRALADYYYGRDPQTGVYDNSTEAFVAIQCVDNERTTDRAVLADTARRMTEAAPFLDSGRGEVAALGVCALWPVPPTSEPHVPQVDALPPTLVVSTTGDPATPYEAGVRLAEVLDASLLTVEGYQHTAALGGEACVDDIVTAYLVDLTLPADGARCTLQSV